MNLLGISGSLRTESLNTGLVKAASELFSADSFTLADLRMPLYDGDLEAAEGLPEAARTLIAQMRAADAIVISTPEYNHAPPGVLKNALDWTSREKPFALEGKPVAVISATAGSGGHRAQAMLKTMLIPFRPHFPTGPDVFVGGASGKFDGGRLTDEATLKFLGELMDSLKALAVQLGK